MEDIRLLFALQKKAYTPQVAYDYFCSELENTIFYVFGLKDTMDKLGQTESDEKNILWSLIFSASNVIYMNACCAEVRSKDGRNQV